MVVQESTRLRTTAQTCANQNKGASADLPRKSGFEPDFQQGGKDRAGHDRKDRAGQEGLGKGRKERAGAGKKGQVKGMPKCTPTYMIVNLHAFRGLSNGLYWQLASLRRKIRVVTRVVMGSLWKLDGILEPGCDKAVRKP